MSELCLKARGYTAEYHGGVYPRLVLTGSANVEKPEELRAFLAQVHAAAMGAGADKVVIDMVSLEFLNSTGFKPLVWWADSLMALQEEARYELHFRYDAKRRWQLTSLSALACFAPGLVVTEQGPVR
jgi:hypothetical protein